MTLKIAFMGTPEFSIPTLRSLIEAGHDIKAVYTQPPRPAGRGKKLRPSPIESFAIENGLNVFSPTSLKDPINQEKLKKLDLDVAIVVAYGLILPKEILETPKHGAINVHASLLPRWRGAAPIHRAIMAGDKETGITIMQMDEGLDTGPILSMTSVPIKQDATTQSLHDELSELGGKCLGETLIKLEKGTLTPRTQPKEGMTYAPKIEKSEAQINWQDTAKDIDRKVRGLNPFPGAWFSIKGERIKVLKGHEVEMVGPVGQALDDQMTIGCGEGAYKIEIAQKAGKAPMKIQDFLRGSPISKGTQADPFK